MGFPPRDPTTTKPVTLSVQITHEMHQQIKDAANGRTLSEFTREALRLRLAETRDTAAE